VGPVTEYRLILAALVGLCALAPLTLVWPVLDTVLCALLLGAGAAGLAGYWLREAARELRFRRDMRALDTRDAARAAARTEVPA